MNLLLAWELGGGLGHVARLQGLGRLLREDGHKLTYAYRNPGGRLSCARAIWIMCTLPLP